MRDPECIASEWWWCSAASSVCVFFWRSCGCRVILQRISLTLDTVRWSSVITNSAIPIERPWAPNVIIWLMIIKIQKAHSHTLYDPHQAFSTTGLFTVFHLLTHTSLTRHGFWNQTLIISLWLCDSVYQPVFVIFWMQEILGILHFVWSFDKVEKPVRPVSQHTAALLHLCCCIVLYSVNNGCCYCLFGHW